MKLIFSIIIHIRSINIKSIDKGLSVLNFLGVCYFCDFNFQIYSFIRTTLMTVLEFLPTFTIKHDSCLQNLLFLGLKTKREKLLS